MFYSIIVGGVVISIILIRKFKIESKWKLCKIKKRLDGETILITGGNSGIGLAAAQQLAQTGAELILTCRDERKAEDTIKLIKQQTPASNVVSHVT